MLERIAKASIQIKLDWSVVHVKIPNRRTKSFVIRELGSISGS